LAIENKCSIHYSEMMSTGEPRVALIHDELVRRGGAEIVFEELIRIFPQADVYALYAGTPRITIDGQTYPIHTSFLQNFPLWWRRHPSRLLPFLAQAAEQFDFAAYDVVLSSASAFAKAIVTRSNVPHICYCHTPTRYVWDSTHEVLGRSTRLGRGMGRFILHYLRLVDYAAAQRVDRFIANSEYTRQRIATYYRQGSTVIYPPIDTIFFHPDLRVKRGTSPTSFLIVGRLTPTKYFEQAINVSEKLHFPLRVVGVGSEYSRLKRLAGKHTTFLGKISREELRQEYRQARALLQPGVEDFGMAAAEALACGTPVIALGEGGAREIVQPYTNGLLYTEQRPEALAEAIRQFLAMEERVLPEQLQQAVLRFSRSIFEKAIRDQVASTLRHLSFARYTRE
jgi:glycosyltransferase involved in cell wall biosynthesis